jgi:hypothetical protein
MKAVRNERVKLTANFLNGTAIAVMAVGGLTPVVQAMRTITLAAGDWWRTTLIVLVCTFIAGALHLTGRAVLGGLEE